MQARSLQPVFSCAFNGSMQAWDLSETSIGHPLHVFQGGTALQMRLPSCVPARIIVMVLCGEGVFCDRYSTVGQMDVCHGDAVLRLTCVQGEHQRHPPPPPPPPPVPDSSPVREESSRAGGVGNVHTRLVSCDAGGGWISWGFTFLAGPSATHDAGVRMGKAAAAAAAAAAAGIVSVPLQALSLSCACP